MSMWTKEMHDLECAAKDAAWILEFLSKVVTWEVGPAAHGEDREIEIAGKTVIITAPTISIRGCPDHLKAAAARLRAALKKAMGE